MFRQFDPLHVRNSTTAGDASIYFFFEIPTAVSVSPRIGKWSLDPSLRLLHSNRLQTCCVAPPLNQRFVVLPTIRNDFIVRTFQTHICLKFSLTTSAPLIFHSADRQVWGAVLISKNTLAGTWRQGDAALRITIINKVPWTKVRPFNQIQGYLWKSLLNSAPLWSSLLVHSS